jgi:hypothetical protein
MLADPARGGQPTVILQKLESSGAVRWIRFRGLVGRPTSASRRINDLRRTRSVLSHLYGWQGVWSILPDYPSARAKHAGRGAPSNKEVREVKHYFRTWRLTARVLVLALALAAVPLPALAGDTNTPVPGLKASIASAAAKSGALEQAKPAAVDKTELGSTSFFKKPVGIVVLAVLGAGIGYMAYSMSNDRIHSVARANQ